MERNKNMCIREVKNIEFNPLVSIVIPVYNGSNYLKDAIESAINQTYSNIETIVINDGSDDDGETEKICLEYGDKIRYFKKDNGGVSTALNLAIKNMNGEYFSWLSHDDYYYKDKILNQLSKIKECGDMTRIVLSNYDVLNVESNSLYNVKLEEQYEIEQLTKSVFSILQTAVHGCSLLIHKSHFDRIGLFDEKEKTMQDHEMWFKMFRNQHLVFCDKSAVCVRVHKESGTNTIKSFVEDLGKIYLKSIMSLTREEICDMYDSPIILYHRIAGLFKSYGLKDSYYKVIDLIKKEESYSNKIIMKNDNKLLYENLYNDLKKKIYIFGAGNYGVRVQYDLFVRGILVQSFIDNNKLLWGKKINGVVCLSPNEIVNSNDDICIIVAVRNPTDILSELKGMGFKNVICRQELEKVILKINPINYNEMVE